MYGERARWGLFAIVGATCGCGDAASDKDLHDPVRGYFEQRGIEIESITCAGELSRRPGSTVDCEVMVGDESVAVGVEVTDERGGLSILPRHLTLVTARVEPEIAQTLRAQGYEVADVQCQGQVWIATPASERHCEVLVQGGERYAWRGVFSGHEAEHRVYLTPLSAKTEGQ
ncbi:MAG: DUF4333 domain-containing protein [Deltaproteobacteria bacterium]|nr:DUF4333 domain-containing protein [Deltaproteobacteria bacterium]